MAVTLNLKSSKSFPELLGALGTDIPNANIINGADIYYQTHCFDLVISLGGEEGTAPFLCVRFETKLVGSLMQGLIAKTPKMELQKSVIYCVKNFCHLASIDPTPKAEPIKKVSASSVHCAYAVVGSYFQFLDALGDAKACPAGLKPKVSAPEPVKEDADGNEIASMVAEAASSDGSVEKVLGHGVVLHDAQYAKAYYPEHNECQKVDLRVATALNQKVRGTSVNSLYYVCGLSSTYNMAYRGEKGTLSIRVVTPKKVKVNKGSKSLDRLTQAGLDLHFDGDTFSHASLHLEGMNYISAKRVIGAVIADLDIFQPEQTLTSGLRLAVI